MEGFEERRWDRYSWLYVIVRRLTTRSYKINARDADFLLKKTTQNNKQKILAIYLQIRP